MIVDKMVIRFKDRSLMKGSTSDFSNDKPAFNLKLLNGKVEKVLTKDLKAVFIVKNFDGDKKYNCTYRDFLPWGGNKIKVKFNDGEVMIGYTPYYPEAHQDFFITPADLQCNNKEVYVVNSATKEIIYM